MHRSPRWRIADPAIGGRWHAIACGAGRSRRRRSDVGVRITAERGTVVGITINRLRRPIIGRRNQHHGRRIDLFILIALPVCARVGRIILSSAARNTLGIDPFARIEPGRLGELGFGIRFCIIIFGGGRFRRAGVRIRADRRIAVGDGGNARRWRARRWRARRRGIDCVGWWQGRGCRRIGRIRWRRSCSCRRISIAGRRRSVPG